MLLNILNIFIFIRPFISSTTYIQTNLVFSIIILGLLCIWLLRHRSSLRKINGLVLPLSIFILTLIISIIFSISPLKSLGYLYNHLIYILIFAFAASLSMKQKNKIIYTIILSGLAVSLMALYQYFFGFKYLLNYLLEHNINYGFGSEFITRKRVFAPFVTPNTLAGFLILILPLTLLKKRFHFFFIPIALTLILTKSIGASLSLLAGFIIYIFLKETKGQKKLEKKFMILLLIASIIGLMFIWRNYAGEYYSKPIFSLSRRLDYWKAVLRIIKTHPITGIGIGNFNLALSRYAHNLILQLWAETGIIGVLGFIFFLISILKQIFINIKNSLDKHQIICLLTAIAIFLIHNLVDFTFFLPEVSLLWWAILGLSINNDEVSN